MSAYGPRISIERSCHSCKACAAESYKVQGDSGQDVYCAHPSLPDRKRIGDTRWVTPEWCPAAPAEVKPIKGESRFAGEKEWHPCAHEHVSMVLAAPHEWKGYEVRYLYAGPVLAQGAVAPEPVAEVVLTLRPPNASPAWKPHKMIHASLAWFDKNPVGTKLFAEPVIQAAAVKTEATRQYRLLTRSDVIDSDTEFLQDDFSWHRDTGAVWVGSKWTPELRPARCAMAG